MLKEEIVKNKYILLFGLGLLSNNSLLMGMQNTIATGQAQTAIDKIKKRVEENKKRVEENKRQEEENKKRENEKQENEQKRIQDKHKKRLLEDANDNATQNETEEQGNWVDELPKTIKNNKVHLSKLERHTIGAYTNLKKIILALDDEIDNIKKKLTDLNSKYEDFKKESNVDFNTILQSDFDNLPQNLHDKYFSFIDTDEKLRKALTSKVKIFEKKYTEYQKKAGKDVDAQIDDKVKKNISFDGDDALRGGFLKRYSDYEKMIKNKQDIIEVKKNDEKMAKEY